MFGDDNLEEKCQNLRSRDPIVTPDDVYLDFLLRNVPSTTTSVPCLDPGKEAFSPTPFTIPQSSSFPRFSHFLLDDSTPFAERAGTTLLR
jgi:hypothetical protein